MKRKGYIYEKIIDRKNLTMAAFGLSKTKKSKAIREEIKENLKSIVDGIIENPHFDGKYKRFFRKEGDKIREIFEPSLNDQILGNAIRNVIIPLIRPREYFHSYAAMKGKGPLLARNAVARYVRRRWARWFCKLDIVRCFPTFPIHLVMEVYDHLFKDKKARELIAEDLKAYTDFISSDKGIALGQGTSQEWCNLVLTFACYYAKQHCGVKALVEYMDDFVLIGSSKKELTKERDEFKKILRQFGFELHDERDSVKPIEYVDRRGEIHGEQIDFCGYRIYKKRCTLRRRLFKKIRRCTLRCRDKPANQSRARRFLSYLGFLQHSESRNFMAKYGVDDSFIDRMKKIAKGEIKPCFA